MPFLLVIPQNTGAISAHNPSINHTPRYSEDKLIERDKRINSLETEVGSFRNLLKRAASQLSKLKRWGIEMNDEMTQYYFYRVVFMVLLEIIFLDNLARESQHGWAGLADLYTDIRDANAGASSCWRQIARQQRSVTDEVRAPRPSYEEIEQKLKEAEGRIKYLEKEVEEARNPQPPIPQRNNEEEVEMLFEAANIVWGAVGSASQPFLARHQTIDEALQRQEDYAAARNQYELRRARERRIFRSRLNRRSNR